MRLSKILLSLAITWSWGLGKVCSWVQVNRLGRNRHTRIGFQEPLSEIEPEEPLYSNNVRVRDPTYREVTLVADTIMRCFYAESQAPAKQLHRLGEINRMQQNFPYDREKHRMFVAAAKNDSTGRDEKIVAFCDIDARKPNQNTMYRYNPRPYLSDLCVDPDFQRRGIAQMLVKACEDFCRELDLDEVFIRVERTNKAALAMYTKLGYKEHSHPDDDSEKVMLLRKDLLESGENAVDNKEATKINATVI